MPRHALATPRSTRLVRVSSIQAFRQAVVSLAIEDPALAARDRLVVVPTRASAAQLIRSIEDHVLPSRRAVVLPDLATSRELTRRLGERVPLDRRMLTDAEREVLLGVACRAARDAGV